MTTRLFHRDWLERRMIAEGVDGPWIAHRELVEDREYSTVFAVVLRYDYGFWRMEYQLSNATDQDVDHWFNLVEVEATQVWPVAAAHIVWQETPLLASGDVASCTWTDERGMTDVCQDLAPWIVVYQSGETARKADLCDVHVTAAMLAPHCGVREVRKR